MHTCTIVPNNIRYSKRRPQFLGILVQKSLILQVWRTGQSHAAFLKQKLTLICWIIKRNKIVFAFLVHYQIARLFLKTFQEKNLA